VVRVAHRAPHPRQARTHGYAAAARAQACGLNEGVDVSNGTHNQWMIHRELGDQYFLARERSALPGLLVEDEELLAVASGSVGVFAPGILAIIDRRFIHLYFRRLLRQLEVTEIGYPRIKSVHSVRQDPLACSR